MSRVSLGTRLTESMLATSAPVLRHSFRTVAVFVFAAPFAVATPAIEARRTSDKIRAEIVGKENWHARGGGEQVAFKQFLPDVDRPRGELLRSWRGFTSGPTTWPRWGTSAEAGVEVDRQLPTNITDPPSVINVNHIRAKNYGGNNTGGPTYTPATLEGCAHQANRTAALPPDTVRY